MAGDIIKAKVVFDTSAVSGPMGKLAGNGSGSVGGALGGMSGKGGGIKGLLGAGAMAGAVAAGVTVLLKAVKTGFEAVKRASPQLQATLSIFSKGIMMVLRPIGDAISSIFRPLAIRFLRWSIEFYKTFKDSMKELKDKFSIFGEKKEGTSGAVGKLGELGGDVKAYQDTRQAIEENSEAFGGLSNLVLTFVQNLELLHGIWLILWGTIKILTGSLIILGEIFLYFVDKVIGPLIPLLNLVADIFLSIGQFISDIGTAWYDLATGGSVEDFKKAVSEAFGKLIGNLKQAFIGFWETVKIKIAEFGQGIIDGVKKDWEAIKVFFTEIVPSWILMGFNVIKSFFTETIPDWFRSMVSKVKDLLSTIPFIGGMFEGRQHGGGVSAGKSYMVGENGPEMFTSSQSGNISPSGSFGGGGSVTININAMDASGIDSTVLDKITDAVYNSMRRGMSGMTTETIGG